MCQMGVDGLRLDVADELSDEFIENINIALRRNKKDGFIIGEVWENPMRMGRGYISCGKGMHSVMNYQLVDALMRYYKYGDVTKLAYIIRDIRAEYPDATIETLMNFTSTHDISRLIDFHGTEEFNEYSKWAWDLRMEDRSYQHTRKLSMEEYTRGKEVSKSYSLALSMMPGMFSIFYGDEVGVTGLGNLENRKPFLWDGQDIELLNFYRELCRVRKRLSVIKSSNINVLELNRNYFMFERYDDLEKVLVVANRSKNDLDFDYPKEYERGVKVLSLKNSSLGNLKAYGGIVIQK